MIIDVFRVFIKLDCIAFSKEMCSLYNKSLSTCIQSFDEKGYKRVFKMNLKKKKKTFKTLVIQTVQKFELFDCSSNKYFSDLKYCNIFI